MSSKRIACKKEIMIPAGSATSRAMKMRKLAKHTVIKVMIHYEDCCGKLSDDIEDFISDFTQSLIFFDPSIVGVGNNLTGLMPKLAALEFKYNSKFLERYTSVCMSAGALGDELAKNQVTRNGTKDQLLDEFLNKYPALKKEDVEEAMKLC